MLVTLDDKAIIRLMQEHHLNKQDLREALHVKWGYVNRMLKGLPVTENVVPKIEAAFGLKAEEFVLREGSRRKRN